MQISKMEITMKTTLLLIVVLLVCGCEHKIQTSSIGSDVIVTNGAAWVHHWNHQDTYDFISNTIPQ